MYKLDLKCQKLDLKCKKLDFKSQKLDFESKKLDFPAFYLSGFKCTCAEKKPETPWVGLTVTKSPL